MPVHIVGIDGVIGAMLAVESAKIRKGYFKALLEQATAVKDLAVELCPDDTGALRSTARVSPVRKSEILDASYIEVTFGGDTEGGYDTEGGVVSGPGGVFGPGVNSGRMHSGPVDYAVIVHEDLSKNHPTGQAKYLETAINTIVGGMVQAIADTVGEEL